MLRGAVRISLPDSFSGVIPNVFSIQIDNGSATKPSNLQADAGSDLKSVLIVLL